MDNSIFIIYPLLRQSKHSIVDNLFLYPYPSPASRGRGARPHLEFILAHLFCLDGKYTAEASKNNLFTFLRDGVEN